MNKHQEYFAQVRLRHRQTKSRLRALLSGAPVDEKPVLSPADSPVGQWIYQEGLPVYGHLPEMHALEKLHALIHREAGHLVSLYRAGQAEEARKGLLHTEEISSLLEELINKIEAKTQPGGPEALPEDAAAGKAAGSGELQGAKDRLERFFNQAPAAICVLDGPEMVFELANRHFRQLYPGRELLGKRVLEALPEMARNPLYPVLKNIYQAGETFEGKEVLFPLARHAGGPLEEMYFNFIYQPRFNEQGAVDGIIAFGYEVTTQVLARRQVEESRQRFQMLSEAIPQMVWTAAPDGQVDYYNHQWYAYTGLDFAQSRGQGWVQVIHPQDLVNLQFHWSESLRTTQPYQIEARMRRADGVYRWFLIRALPLQDEAGNVKQWLGTDTDIQDRKEVEETLYKVSQELFAANGELAAANEEIRASHEELAATNQRLLHINADLDNFIYTASHDLKAPILNIEGLMKVLVRRIDRQAGADPEVQQIFTLMEASVLRFKETISDLTDIARIQKQTGQESEPVDLPQIVQDTLSDLAPQIEESGAHVEKRLGDCSAILFTRKNLKSVVYNLLSNALKYRHPQRPPRIVLSCYREGDYQVVSVADNGLGMHVTDQGKIFGMFKRLHAHVEGTGIGLYIVKKMVENAGGKIAVESKAGEGSVFRVYFKRQPVQ